MNFLINDGRFGLKIEAMLFMLNTKIYVQMLMMGRIAAKADRLNIESLILQRDLSWQSVS